MLHERETGQVAGSCWRHLVLGDEHMPLFARSPEGPTIVCLTLNGAVNSLGTLHSSGTWGLSLAMPVEY